MIANFVIDKVADTLLDPVFLFPERRRFSPPIGFPHHHHVTVYETEATFSLDLLRPPHLKFVTFNRLTMRLTEFVIFSVCSKVCFASFLDPLIVELQS